MVARERFAWIWLLTLVTTYAAYFVAVALAGETAFWTQIQMFAAATIAQLTIIIPASAYIALTRRQGPEMDERDRFIEHRAGAFAYKVLITGMILVGGILPFSHSGWRLFHAAVFAIALAEIVRHGLIVTMYRRGWHG